MKKSFVVLIHIGFWACYCLLIVIMLGVYYRSSSPSIDRDTRIMNALLTIFFFTFVPSFISYFSFYLFIFPKFLKQKKFILFVFYGILIPIGAAVIGYLLLRYFIESGRITDMDEAGKNGRSTAISVIIIMTIIGIITGVVALIINGFITWFSEIKLKDALKEKNHEMEMAMVKLQLDPHLLFNTINNIDALILKDAVAASDYLNKLSDIMRFILYETKTPEIPLAKEIEYIEKYIALQKIRTSNESYVHLSVQGIVGNKNIAPMVFIPFIENAFKHTNNKKLENAIIVNILINEETIQLQCENKFDPKLKVEHTAGGLGNELIQKRLNLIYAEKHTLTVSKTDDRYTINLVIPNG